MFRYIIDKVKTSGALWFNELPFEKEPLLLLVSPEAVISNKKNKKKTDFLHLLFSKYSEAPLPCTISITITLYLNVLPFKNS